MTTATGIDMSTSPSDAADPGVWAAWTPRELARRLARVSAPWCVAGGWALDLWQGRQTREHEDIEFTVLAEDVALFRRTLGGLTFHTAHDGVVTPLAPHQPPPPSVSQVWCLEPDTRLWRADMMIERGTPETWIYKRDPRLTCARSEIVRRTADGIPYLSPAVILLFKAKHRRSKDEADFARALPELSGPDRRRLKAWLAFAHPGHDWGQAL